MSASGWRHPAQVAFGSLVKKGPVLLAVSVTFPGVAPDAVREASYPFVVLRFGQNLTPAIPDMKWDGTGLAGTLTFNGEPYTCKIPWIAVQSIKSEGASSEPTQPRAKPVLKLVP